MVRGFLWRNVARPLFRLTPHNAYPARTLILRCFGMRCGKWLRIRRSAWIDKPWNIRAGDRVIIGDHTVLLAEEPITIGSRCVISQHAMLLTRAMSHEGEDTREALEIEDNCWIAADTAVLPGAHLETGAVVGARALVEGRLPAWKVCTGEPAVTHGDRVLHLEHTSSNIEIIIPVKNEELNLPHALQSVMSWADRVWVVDSGSTDRTMEIAREYGAEVVEQAWLGFARQKNWAIDTLPFDSDWVFVLDADEAIDDELRTAMLAISRRPVDDVLESAYSINRYLVFLGHRIRHCGYYPSWNVRFFKRDKARYEDREVHEHMMVEGLTGALPGHMSHEDRRGLTAYIAKHNHYSTLEARETAEAHKSELAGGPSRGRRWIRQHIYPRLPAKWCFRFLWMYVLRLGILDGLTGLRFCLLISFYQFLIGVKAIEIQLQEQSS